MVRQLRCAEGYNDRLVQASVEFNRFVDSHKDLPGFGDPIDYHHDLPRIEIPEAQRELIEDKANESDILDYAVRKERSIQESLTELSEVNVGLGKYLPRRKDEVHNRRVDEIQELIGGGSRDKQLVLEDLDEGGQTHRECSCAAGRKKRKSELAEVRFYVAEQTNKYRQ